MLNTMTTAPGTEATSRTDEGVTPDISVQGADARQQLADALRGSVADTYSLLIKTQGYHWNVEGPLFVSIHELTETQYRDLFDAADNLAERIRALGLKSPGSHQALLDATVLTDDDGAPKTAQEMVAALAHGNEQVARRMKRVSDLAAELGDKVTEDMLIGRMHIHEQNAWMLRAIAADPASAR